MFDALGKAGINIQMISTSEIKISVIVDEDKIEEAARVVHSAFQLDSSSSRNRPRWWPRRTVASAAVASAAGR